MITVDHAIICPPHTNMVVLTFLGTLERSAAPVTPRVVLLGPTGSGKSTMALHLTERYGLVNGEKTLLPFICGVGGKREVTLNYCDSQVVADGTYSNLCTP